MSCRIRLTLPGSVRQALLDSPNGSFYRSLGMIIVIFGVIINSGMTPNYKVLRFNIQRLLGIIINSVLQRRQQFPPTVSKSQSRLPVPVLAPTFQNNLILILEILHLRPIFQSEKPRPGLRYLIETAELLLVPLIVNRLFCSNQ